MGRIVQQLATLILRFEWLFLAAMIAAFWMPQFNRVWSLVLIVPVLTARWVLYRRLWQHTPLDYSFAALIALCVISYTTAPFRQGDIALFSPFSEWTIPYNLIVIGRPLFGIFLAATLIDRAARRHNLREIMWITVFLALLVGVLALFAQLYVAKSAAFMFIIRSLPILRSFPGAEGGFNVNEIGGAMAWFTPLTAGLALLAWREWQQKRSWLLLAFGILASSAFIILWTALFLGQSRFAILGVLPAVAVLAWFLIPRKSLRMIALGVIAFFAVLQLLIFTGSDLFPKDESLQQRDEDSVSSRVLIWASALNIISDYPLTGVGMNNFRYPPVRRLYPVEGYGDGAVLPHAHNEWLQITSDLGIFGVAVFVALQVTSIALLISAWRHGDWRMRGTALAVGSGIAAHMVFAVGDAITLWDRFAFVYWWLIGFSGAQYVLVPRSESFQSSMVEQFDVEGTGISH